MLNIGTGVLRFDTLSQQTTNRKTTFEMNRCDVKPAVVITCSNFILNQLQFAFRTMQGRHGIPVRRFTAEEPHIIFCKNKQTQHQLIHRTSFTDAGTLLSQTTFDPLVFHSVVYDRVPIINQSNKERA